MADDLHLLSELITLTMVIVMGIFCVLSNKNALEAIKAIAKAHETMHEFFLIVRKEREGARDGQNQHKKS